MPRERGRRTADRNPPSTVVATTPGSGGRYNSTRSRGAAATSATLPPRGRGGRGTRGGRGARDGASGLPDLNTSIDQATVDLRQMIYDKVQAAFEMFRAQQTVEEDDSPTVPGDQPITPIVGSGNQLSTGTCCCAVPLAAVYCRAQAG